MTTLYKLTNPDWKTRNGTKWGPMVTHTTNGKGNMCSSGWLHAYKSINAAAIYRHMHVDDDYTVLWLAQGVIDLSDDYKVATSELQTISIIPLPKFTKLQIINITLLSILSNSNLNKSKKFILWVKKWLLNKTYVNYVANNEDSYLLERDFIPEISNYLKRKKVDMCEVVNFIVNVDKLDNIVNLAKILT